MTSFWHKEKNMFSDYRFNMDKNEMNADLISAEMLVKLWKSVSFVSKKDGTPYHILSKNIVGAEIRKKIFASYSYEKELFVYGWSHETGSVHDAIDLYVPVQYASKNYLDKQQNIEDDIYFLDIDDIKNRINESIDYWNGRIEELKTSISRLEEVCNKCDEVRKNLKEFTGNQTLYGVAIDYLKYIL